MLTEHMIIGGPWHGERMTGHVSREFLSRGVSGRVRYLKPVNFRVTFGDATPNVEIETGEYVRRTFRVTSEHYLEQPDTYTLWVESGLSDEEATRVAMDVHYRR